MFRLSKKFELQSNIFTKSMFLMEAMSRCKLNIQQSHTRGKSFTEDLPFAVTDNCPKGGAKSNDPKENDDDNIQYAPTYKSRCKHQCQSWTLTIIKLQPFGCSTSTHTKCIHIKLTTNLRQTMHMLSSSSYCICIKMVITY